MDPIVFEILGSLLVAGMAYLTVFQRLGNLTVFHRHRHSQPQALPMLEIRKTRTVSHRHRYSPSAKVKARLAAPKSKKKPKMKPIETTVESTQESDLATNASPIPTACPSCGLQAPEKLLAEHFLSSPSHRNGPQKITTTTTEQVEAEVKAEDDSNQSVRNLLQILVPPRAFGRRHSNRLASPIPSVVHPIGTNRRNYP